MPKYLQSMPTKHPWTFKPRLRSRAFGWKGSHLACQRLKEAVAEVKKVARVDPVTAGEGVVSLMERIWPAFQDVDTSSGALGGAVYWAQNELLPIAIEAPADRKTRDAWLDRLWQAIQDDGVDYLSPVEDRWGELCRSGEVASHWADQLLGLLRTAWSDPRPGNYVREATVCLSSLVAAGRHQELLKGARASAIPILARSQVRRAGARWMVHKHLKLGKRQPQESNGHGQPEPGIGDVGTAYWLEGDDAIRGHYLPGRGPLCAGRLGAYPDGALTR
jgi:hypothetical protein